MTIKGTADNGIPDFTGDFRVRAVGRVVNCALAKFLIKNSRVSQARRKGLRSINNGAGPRRFQPPLGWLLFAATSRGKSFQGGCGRNGGLAQLTVIGSTTMHGSGQSSVFPISSAQFGNPAIVLGGIRQIAVSPPPELIRSMALFDGWKLKVKSLTEYDGPFPRMLFVIARR